MARKDVQITVKVLDQASANLNKIASTAEGSIGRVQGLLAGAGMAAPLAYITKATYGWMAAVNDLEDATGMAGEEASKLLAIGSSVGLSAETMQTSFVKMAKSVSTAQDAMQQAAAAGKESDDIYSRFGITIQDTNGKLLPAEQILKNILEVHRKLPNGIEKTNMEMEIFGKKGAVLNDFLNLSASEVDRLTKKFEKLGLIVGGESSQKWEDLRNKTRELEFGVKGLTVQIGDKLLPALQNTVDYLNDTMEAYGALDENQKLLIGSTVKLGAELGGFQVILASLLPGWARLAAYVGIAANELDNYITKAEKARGIITVVTGQASWDPQGWITGKVSQIDVGTEKDWVTRQLEASSHAAKPPPGRGGDDRRVSAAGGGGSSIQSMQEKLANIIDDFNAKIMQETGTVFEGNAARLSAEISKIGRDLDEMATKGMDVTAARNVLAKYSGTMTDKYTKDQARALSEMKAETALITADITGDYVKAADAQYQATVLSIQKQAEERRKTSGNTTAVLEWEIAKTKEAEQAKLQTVIDGESKKHAMRLQGMDFQRQQGLVSAETYRTGYLAEVEAFIAANQKKLQSLTEFSDQWKNLTQATSEAIAQKHRLLGQDITTAWNEALYRMDQNSYDYANRITSTFDEMGNTLSTGLYETLTNTGDGLKNVFGDICNSLLKMWVDMVVQMYIMAPMKNMFSSILGGAFSGAGGGTVGPTMSQNTFAAMQYSQIMGTHSVGSRASGGPVSAGQMYKVNELGIETFVPSTNGFIMTAGQTKKALAGTSPNIQIQVVNQTGTPARARQQSSFDSETNTAVISIVLDALETDRGGLRTAIGGLRG